jgi:hypothetical protein
MRKSNTIFYQWGNCFDCVSRPTFASWGKRDRRKKKIHYPRNWGQRRLLESMYELRRKSAAGTRVGQWVTSAALIALSTGRLTTRMKPLHKVSISGLRIIAGTIR